VIFKEKDNDFYRFTYKVISGNQIEQYIYHISDINDFTNHLISFQLKSPVYHFSKSVYFEIGASFDYYISSFNIKFDRTAVRVTNGITEVLSNEEREEYKFDGNKFYFSPLVSFCYTISGNFNLVFGFIGNIKYPQSALGLEVSI
jgi:hypothetical protein